MPSLSNSRAKTKIIQKFKMLCWHLAIQGLETETKRAHRGKRTTKFVGVGSDVTRFVGCGLEHGVFSLSIKAFSTNNVENEVF
jgi:hypothetical protein